MLSPSLRSCLVASFATLLTATAYALVPVAASARSDVNPAPQVAPALREWSGGAGMFRLLPGSRIVTAKGLAGDARTFRDDLRTITGKSLPVVDGGRPRAGDLSLALDAAAPGDEGYLLDIGDVLTVRGRTGLALFHGTQTVEQLFAISRDRVTAPRGSARDWPAVGQRGFMLDAGRHYYQPAYIEQQIRAMAWLKLNTLHLHLIEHNAFRLVSDSFPGLAAEQAYTKDTIRRIQAVARRYHVTVLPEIDLPAHATAIAGYRPELRWSCSSMGSGFTLDVTKPSTRAFVKKLLDEFVPLFDAPEFDVGTDEYPTQAAQEQCPELVDYAKKNGFATTADVFVGFINFMNQVVRSHGKRTVIWNWWDVSQHPATGPDKNIKVESWTSGPGHYLDLGYDVIASPGDLLYVTPGAPPGGALLPDDQKLYTEWTPIDNARLTGYMISRWSDNAETQPDAYFDWFAHRPQQVFADRAWGGPRQGTHFDLEDRIDRIGPPPGVPDVPADALELSGTPYGTSPAWDGSDATYDKVFDGKPDTFFDYAKADGGYAGIDLGAGHDARVAKIRFVPRAPTQMSRMVGGRFQGCSRGPADGCTDLATVRWRPAFDWTQLSVENPARFRWLRYVSPPGGYANVAEVKFYAAPESAGRVDVHVPAVLRPLGGNTVTTTFTNTGTTALRDVELGLTAYGKSQFVALPTRPSTRALSVVPPGGRRTVRWRLDVPLDTVADDYRIAGTARWQRDSAGSTQAAASSLVPSAVQATLDPTTLVATEGVQPRTTLKVSTTAGAAITLDWTATPPDGVTVSPRHGTVRIPATGSAAATISVTASGKPGVRDVPVQLVVRGRGQSLRPAPLHLRVSAPYPSLAAAADNTGVTDDGDVAPPDLAGGVDGDGSSYSAQALAAAGVARGGSVSHGGVTFTWPDAAPGGADNVLANGQTIHVDKTGHTLGLLTVGTYGPIGGTGTVRYSDGTTQNFNISDPDWQDPAAPSSADVAVTTPYHNLAASGRVTRSTYLFFHGVRLDPAKKVALVTLPAVSSTVTGGTPALHVFAVAVD